jgi:hypothetical protein
MGAQSQSGPNDELIVFGYGGYATDSTKHPKTATRTATIAANSPTLKDGLGECEGFHSYLGVGLFMDCFIFGIMPRVA